jgi:hypothetical protein
VVLKQQATDGGVVEQLTMLDAGFLTAEDSDHFRQVLRTSDERGGESFATQPRGAKAPTLRIIGLPDLMLNPLDWISSIWHISFTDLIANGG